MKSTTTPAAWPDKVMRQFWSIPTNPDESDFHGVYNKLLYTLFPPDSDYTVVPKYLKPGSLPSPDRIMTFEVVLEHHPVLILQLKNPGDIHIVSAREMADFQIRQRMVDLRGKPSFVLLLYTFTKWNGNPEYCPLPTLNGISAMGTALCFYSLDTKNQNAAIRPLGIAQYSIQISDTAPKDRWYLDVLTVEGETKFRTVVEEIKQACANLGDSFYPDQHMAGTL